jgi:hypothetical protein
MQQRLASDTPLAFSSVSKLTPREHDWQTKTTNLPELRSTLGVFVQSARFISRYAHIVAPLTALTRSSAGKPVPYLWYDKTCGTTKHKQHMITLEIFFSMESIHLSPPDYRLPFQGCGDASNDGKSFGLNQYNDLPPTLSSTTRNFCTSATSSPPTMKLAAFSCNGFWARKPRNSLIAHEY